MWEVLRTTFKNPLNVKDELRYLKQFVRQRCVLEILST